MFGELKNKIILVAVDMGYGHQRTAYPLRFLAWGNKAINANNYKGMPGSDRRIWETSRKFYEFISDFKKVPFIGQLSFNLYNRLQKINDFYPKRDLSSPDLNLKVINRYIKKGWGKDLIKKAQSVNLANGGNMPFVSTFFTPVFMAEHHGYSGDIYCVVCDADISRAWAPINPHKSRIKYLASNNWVKNRLKLYGVREENICLSGYPLPMENIGQNNEILKEDLKKRIINLDPWKIYRKKADFIIERYLGQMPALSGHIPTILFSIGGAGAQKEIVINFIQSLRHQIFEKKLKIIIACGIKKGVKEFFENYIQKNKTIKNLKGGIEVISSDDIYSYFSLFNSKLRESDILWTKPSELSFYAGLGIPIIIAPTVGSQEDFNKKWLLRLGAGIIQENPKFASEWLMDYLDSGRLAEVAMEGYAEINKNGVEVIKKITLSKKHEKDSISSDRIFTSVSHS